MSNVVSEPMRVTALTQLAEEHLQIWVKSAIYRLRSDMWVCVSMRRVRNTYLFAEFCLCELRREKLVFSSELSLIFFKKKSTRSCKRTRLLRYYQATYNYDMQLRILQRPPTRSRSTRHPFTRKKVRVPYVSKQGDRLMRFKPIFTVFGTIFFEELGQKCFFEWVAERILS